MPVFSATRIRTMQDLRRFESELALEEYLPERSVYEVLVGSAARHGARTALTMIMTGDPDEQPRRVTYCELLGLVHRAANLFTSLGGECPAVAYILPNLIETHATLWGAEATGLAIPINPLLRPEYIIEVLTATGASVLVTMGPQLAPELWQKILAVREQLPALKILTINPPGAPLAPGTTDLAAGLAAQADDRLIAGQPRDGNATAALFHTGGTTGTPKIVIQTQRNQLVNSFLGGVMLGMTEHDVLTGTLPMFHIAASFSALFVFMTCGHLPIFSPAGLRNPRMLERFWKLLEQYRVTVVAAVPTSLSALLQVPLAGADLGSVRAVYTGTAPLPPAVGAAFARAAGLRLHQMYGMTEVAGMIATTPAYSEGGEDSVGWPIPYHEVHVRRFGADGRSGEPCAASEVGVITVRGPAVSPGYLNPAHNIGVFERGTLITGDLAFLDPQGRLHITGRAKDLIIRSGHNIDPVMIENAMSTHPAVSLAAAVGMPDASAGELPVCFVTLRAGATASEADLRVHAERTIAERPAWPREIVILEQLPLTALGKLFKPALRVQAARRRITRLLHDELDLPAAGVEVETGGRSGLRVRVRLPPEGADSAYRVEQALAAFLFESEVLRAWEGH
jgi:fatty-acyl-CoA synthase